MSLFIEDLLPAIQDDVLKGCLKTAMVIRANNVSEYLYLRSDRERWYNAHFHNVAPPAPILWIEWRYPERTNSNGRSLPFDPHLAGRRSGALILCNRGKELPTPEGPFTIPEGGWVGQGTLFVDLDKDAGLDWRQPLGTVIWMVGKLGELVCVRPGSFGVIPGKQMPDGMEQDPTWKQWLSTSMYVPWLTLSFLNCKNVALEKSVVPSHQILKKRRASGFLPPIRFHVLKIGLPPMRRGASGFTGASQAKGLHICRGHFKTFDDKPLFGKLRGTWWWPLILRGDRGRGTISKEYEVNP